MDYYLISPNPNSLGELTPNQAAFVGGLFGTMLTISLIIGVLLIIAGWKIFEKAGEKGWKILIPIYDVYILFKICGLKNWFWAMLGLSIITAIMMVANTPPYIEDAYGLHIDYEALTSGNYIVYLAALVISCVYSIVFTVMVAIRLSKAFGKGIGYTLGIIFLPNIFTLILGFGKAKYSAKNLDK